jgi:hypothetical protein
MCENTMKTLAYKHCTNFTLQLHGNDGKKTWLTRTRIYTLFVPKHLFMDFRVN